MKLVPKKRKYGYKTPKKLKEKGQAVQNLIQEVIKRAAVDRQKGLVTEIVNRLKVLAFDVDWEDEEATKQFFKERIIILKDQEKNYVYMDFKSVKEPGTLILWYNENMGIEAELNHEKHTVDLKIV